LDKETQRRPFGFQRLELDGFPQTQNDHPKNLAHNWRFFQTLPLQPPKNGFLPPKMPFIAFKIYPACPKG
jgi:hypothetical protein